MKKTLITVALIAASAVAASAAVTPTKTVDTFTSQPSTSLFSTAVTDEAGTRIGQAVTITAVFDWEVLTSASVLDATNDTYLSAVQVWRKEGGKEYNKLGFGFSSDGSSLTASAGYGDSTTAALSVNDLESYVDSNNKLVLTLAVTETAGTFYVYDAQKDDLVTVGTSTDLKGTYTWNYNTVYLNALSRDFNNGYGAMELFYGFNSTLTAQEVYNVSQAIFERPETTLPVPEPATATLSLLALAGLAARRRRK